MGYQLDKRQFEILDMLVKFNTESPPGRNTDPLQDEIETLLKQLDFSIQREQLYDNDSVIVATLKGHNPQAPKLILNGHVDVASVDDDQYWQYPPFKLTNKDEWLYGRGVSDMKGGMSSLFYVLEQLHQEGVRPEGDIIVQSVVGEEVGEAGTKRACEIGPKGDLALVLDTSENQALGQGGVITGWITVKSKNTIHDGARSQTIHAGGGLFGASAIEKMTKVIQSLNELERHWAVMKKSPGMPPGANTINPAVIEGGRHPAFIADECRLWITVHYLPNESYESVVDEIEEYLNKVAEADVWLRENPLEFEWGGTSMIEDKGEIFPSFTVPTHHPGFKQLEEAHEHIHNKKLEHGMSTTVTDGGWTAHFGIPTILYGPGSLEEAHSVDEKIKIKELAQYSDVLYTFLKEWYVHPQSYKSS
ncbi:MULTISPECIES: acetylornithine deacetylase [Staphylococcus]|uniref:acetylornithine deacetylase n=1 Tax=Staphylococcus TaxID=1279 RepID=UPI0009ACF949|nr:MULTISPECIES: acetylornithine deacetylase [Staphylococcus]MBC2997834.1 acetylornithine deacetylase [Staphylococcus epidermidis]MBC3051343.1 acetylornithine deacetylase [Staphylococcus epidermidis]MBC3062549.1 acetylornithine deacetylase [Staphylococcus epidermidis]MBM0751301.1 acetylornithine deacetylase [Staphylococcus epidermidis]MCD8868465.1 acetylornithine deacetylase [Staphylococcus epidermidis]